MFIFGNLEDQTLILVWEQIARSSQMIRLISSYAPYEEMFFGLLYPLETSQPVLSLIISWFTGAMGSYSYQLLTLLTLLANLYVSLKYFDKYKFGYVFALIFSFSTYVWSHYEAHLFLIQIWTIPIFLYLMEKVFSGKTSPLLFGAYLTLVFLISNYLGFFCLLTLGIYFVSRAILKKIRFEHLKDTVITYLVFVGCSFILLLPYFLTTNLKDVRTARPYEDFFSFSSRPWYFFLPSEKNPFLGNISANMLDEIKGWDYFLADDYFAREHQSSYFGVSFIALLLVTLIYSVKRKRLVSTELLITSLLIISFMMPPFFTIRGVVFYTPGWLLYKFFPMFRVTARLSVMLLALLCTLIVRNITHVPARTRYILVLILLTFGLLETFIPSRIWQAANPSEVYFHLEGKKFAIYPYSKTDEGMYWLPVHKGFLVNPRGYKNNQFNSEEYTEGLPYGNLRDIEYLVVIGESENFRSREDLKVVEEFDDSTLFSVIK
ncbi:hypothetical protein ACFL13_00705 [Patescibacteria group bacterium]